MPEAVYWDLQTPGLVYVMNEPEGTGKIVVQVDHTVRVKRRQTLVNTVRTGRRITSLDEFQIQNRYALVQKK